MILHVSYMTDIRGDKEASAFRDKVKSTIKNHTGYPEASVKFEGSRRDGSHTTRSDTDLDFTIQGNPKREKVYEELAKQFKAENYNTELKGEDRVLTVRKKGFKADLVLKKRK